MVSGYQIAQIRLARHYLDTLQKANSAIRLGPDNRSFWLKQIQHDWEQIKQWQTWSVSHQTANHDSARLCTEFTSNTSDILHLQLTPAEEFLWAQQALEAARQLHDKQAERALLYQVSFLSLTLEQLDQAERYTDELMEAAQAAHDDLSLGRALYVSGTAAFTRGAIDRAVECYTRSLEKFEACYASEDMRVVWRGMGRALQFQGRYQQAQTYYQQYLTASTVAGNEYDALNAKVALSGICLSLKDYETAEHHAQNAVAMARTLKASRMIPSSLLSLAHAEKWLGKFDTACIHYEEALEAARSVSPASTISNGLYGLGQTKFKQGEYTAALARFNEALEVARAAGHMVRIAEISHDMVFAHLALNDMAEAQGCLREALSTAKQLNTTHFFAKTLAAAISLWHSLGKFKQAAVWAGLLTTHTQYLHPCLFNIIVYAQLEITLGEACYRQAIEKGQTLTLDAVIQDIEHQLNESKSTTVPYMHR